MRAFVFAALLAAAAAHAHADTTGMTVFETHGDILYAMVPADRASDVRHIERAAEKLCESRGYCRVQVWSESLDKPTGREYHPRYKENLVAEFQKDRYRGVPSRVLMNCKMFPQSSPSQCGAF